MYFITKRDKKKNTNFKLRLFTGIFRFKSRLVRCLASGSFILRNIFAMGITLYTPSVALNTVAGVPYWITLLGMTAICILFTLLVSCCFIGTHIKKKWAPRKTMSENFHSGQNTLWERTFTSTTDGGGTLYKVNYAKSNQRMAIKKTFFN